MLKETGNINKTADLMLSNGIVWNKASTFYIWKQETLHWILSILMLLYGYSCRFTLLEKHTVEFNQVAMANSEGSEVMLNRVMTKDNIGVAVLLEVNKDMFSDGKNHF